MLEIGALWALRALAGKVYHLEAERLETRRAGGRAGLDLVSRQSNGKGLWLIKP